MLIAIVAREFGGDVVVIELDAERRAQIDALGFTTHRPASRPTRSPGSRSGPPAPAPTSCSRSPARPQAVLGATALAKVRGTIVVVAIHPTPREIDLQRVFWRELRSSARASTSAPDFETAVELLDRGRIPADLLITEIVPLSETARAFDDLENGRAMKILVDVGGAGMTGPFDLTGTTAVVTGASRGIGFAMAEALAAAGADIIGVSATLAASGQRDRGRRHGARPLVRPASRTDFADRAAVDAPRPSRLSGDAGRHPGQQRRHDRARTRRRPPARRVGPRARRSNLSSQFVLTQAIARGMLERGRGKIIFTASLLSFQGGINVPGYAAAKSGIAGLTQRAGQRVGGAAASTSTRSRPATSRPTTRRRCATTRTARRRSSTASPPAAGARRPTSAGATVFLASPASDYVSGIVLPVDGGWLGR